MDLGDGTKDFVHPEVRAHIISLVSALGGLSVEDEGKYRLGDDALEVLRDLKRWIRFYDEKTNRMDVARCAAEARLIEGDLLPILATWPESESENRFKTRVALACFELMVPLTWPLDRDVERMTVNHHRHIPVLQMAQVGYKRAIINYDGAQILNTAVRVALPAMSIPIRERSPRDLGIIKLVLFFLRNVAMIAPPPGVKYDGDESQISRSAIIDTFSFQDIFMLLLMISSNMGDDFGTEDAVVMEIIFHLVKRVDIDKLFMSDQELHKSRDTELSAMLAREKSMHNYYKKGSGRHNRFGAMIWVKRDGDKMSTLSGPQALLDSTTRQMKMDSTKTFRPPRRGKKEEPNVADLGLAVSLDARANSQLRAFVDEFLDSGFNPLFQHVRKSIDLDAPHLLAHHRRQFFYLVAWFLQAERMRRKQKQKPVSDDVSSFNLVAGVLSQEMFISLSRAMYGSYDTKNWPLLTAVMRCLTEILRTVQEMRECGNEEDEEIAENTLSRLFYEDATHDIVANVIRTYKDQGFDYLDAATELVHHFLRILEAYSKQNVDMQVRSKRRARKQRRAAQSEEGNDGADNAAGEDKAEDEASTERATKERKFSFDRFSARFSAQGTVDSFFAFTKFYRDLNDDQLKRAHRYFYRLCFKQELGVVLFRVDIIHLLHGMIKGPEPLDRSSAMYKEWEELCRQIIKRCVRKMQDRPQLVIEMLFSKIHSTVFFLEKGYNKPVSTPAPRPAAELEFRHATERDHQIGIVVAALLDKNQAELVEWIKGILAGAEKERVAWAVSKAAITAVGGEDSHQPEPDPIMVRPADDTIRNAMYKNAHLRLLMQLCDITRLASTLDETPGSAWIIASSITASRLIETRHFLSQAELSPPASGDSELKRKTAPRKRTVYDDDDEDIMGMIDDVDDDMLFPAGGPTARKVIDADLVPKKTRRRRRKNDEDQEQDEVADSEVEARRQKRRDKEREKARKVKSALYVTAEDDEDDDEYDREFFAREEEIRRRALKAAIEADAVEKDDSQVLGSPSTRIRRAEEALDALLGGRSVEEIVEDSKERRKRKKSPSEDVEMVLSDEEDGENENADDAGAQSDEESENEDETDGTRISPNLKRPKARVARKKRRLSDGPESPAESPRDAPTTTAVNGDADSDVEMEYHEEEDVPLARPRRARVKGGFAVDSDDE